MKKWKFTFTISHYLYSFDMFSADLCKQPPPSLHPRTRTQQHHLSLPISMFLILRGISWRDAKTFLLKRPFEENRNVDIQTEGFSRLLEKG